MDIIFNNPLVSQHEYYENSPEDSTDSPRSGLFHGSKMVTSTSSPKRSRRATQKRVISVPIKDVDGSKLKGEVSMPPSDSWAWRKYGQKPIKGSPYPRGYYRCSSSKGCPARKQVERSRTDSNMLVVTYSNEHNHPWPASKTNHHNHHHSVTTATLTTTTTVPIATSATVDSEQENATCDHVASQSELNSDEQFGVNVGESLLSLISGDEFGWFSEFECRTTLLESPILTESKVTDADMLAILSKREEDDSLFADLGELPECCF